MNDTHLVECDACGTREEVCVRSNELDAGWSIPVSALGYYNGFSDDTTRDDEWRLCHDCVVKFLALFPRLAESLGKGQHPSLTKDKPCCDHAWRGTELFGRYERDDEGNYVPVAGAHVQHAHAGEWIDAD